MENLMKVFKLKWVLAPQKLKFLIVFALFLIFGACSESMFQDDNINDDLNLLSQSLTGKYGKIGISDAANEGIDEFYFLTPTVSKSPKFYGKFHPDLATVVEISDDLEFKRFHQVFTRDDPGNKITVNESEEQYVVNWDTSKSKAEKGKIYRVRVGEKVMGYVDVAIVPRAVSKLENNLIPIVQNETMRIVYRLEDKICPARIEVLPEVATVFIGKTQSFQAKAYNYYGELLNNLKISWTVQDPIIAVIDENGLAKGLSPGQTKVKATSYDVTGIADFGVEEPPTDIKIGEEYGGGIIGYILKYGDIGYNPNVPHGIIVAKQDQSKGVFFGCPTFFISGADGTKIGTGYQNTLDILADCAERPIAASIAKDYRGGGYDDWFLPSKDELYQIYRNRDLIGGFIDTYPGWYLSSSEVNEEWSGSSNDVWVQGANEPYFDMDPSSKRYDGNFFNPSVRPVRYF